MWPLSPGLREQRAGALGEVRRRAGDPQRRGRPEAGAAEGALQRIPAEAHTGG